MLEYVYEFTFVITIFCLLPNDLLRVCMFVFNEYNVCYLTHYVMHVLLICTSVGKSVKLKTAACLKIASCLYT